MFSIADNHNMNNSESQNLEREESHRYLTASVAEEYLFAAPTKYVNAGKTSNLLTSKHLRQFIATVTKHQEPGTKYQELLALATTIPLHNKFRLYCQNSLKLNFTANCKSSDYGQKYIQQMQLRHRW